MQVRNIPLTDICPSNLNPRKTFDQESLNELAENIKENGLIQPITVRKLPKGSDHKFEIVCGERRYRAVTIAGMEEIPCVVRELDDKQAFAAMIIENLQRKDVDPMEEAAAFSKLYTDGTMKIAEIAKMLGKSSSFVTSRIQLNNIIPEFEALMRNGTLYLVHLLEICKLTQDQQKVLYDNCFSEACIARWTQKILKLEILHEMIDEHVMNFLDTAQFSLADSSFACGKDCEGCPFNTKNKPESYKDSARPRCMNAVCFKQKVQEYIFRTAKALDIPIVYQGSKDDAIVQAAEAYGLKLTDMTNRSYVI
ncbi:MAG: ParB/RepB/Spo0J family partition protein, partial [Prevotella sp.]|nr:ParB/RepB/Spo0J family partition protein [Prevotella sp.]